MKLSYQLLPNKFQASPESVFELPRVKKLLTQIVHNENDEYYKTKPFSCQCSLLIPLKTSENQKFSDVFRGIKREHWEEKG